MPIVEEDIDGLSGLLFPFYDADTHMLYLAGKVRTVPSGVMTKTLFLCTICEQSHLILHFYIFYSTTV